MLKKLLSSFAISAVAVMIAILQISPPNNADGVRVPILMYHHFDSTAANDMIVTPEIFEEQIASLCAEGYTSVSFEELCGYVENGTPLPKKPICITMDDGYLSNYDIAYPILQKYNMKATVFVIGSMSGLSFYPVTNYPVTPYFSWKQASEMLSSGVMAIECHTYDMHHWQPYESGERPVRENILPLENESPDEYKVALLSDTRKYIALSESNLGHTPFVFAYPNGKYTKDAEKILTDLGFKVTLTTNPHVNYIFEGDSASLLRLGRFTVTNDISGKELLKIIE